MRITGDHSVPDRNKTKSVHGETRMTNTIIALFGRRQVGKSHIADHLVKEHGFVRLHPFNPGKAGCRKVYEALGATPDQALRMTDTDLKDVPMSLLPRRDLKGKNLAQDPDLFAREFSRGYLEYIGIPVEEVDRMIDGELSHIPDNRIPDGGAPAAFVFRVKRFAADRLWDKPRQGDFRSPKTQNLIEHPDATPGHYTSRHVMERLGSFLGVDLGPAWTLNAEIARSSRVDGDTKGKVVESIVYEAAHLPEVSGLALVRVTSDREIPIESPESDAFIQTIEENASFHNDFTGLGSLGPRFDESMASQGVHYEDPQGGLRF